MSMGTEVRERDGGRQIQARADQVAPHLCFCVPVAGLSLPLSFRAQTVSAETNQGVAKVGFLSMQYQPCL